MISRLGISRLWPKSLAGQLVLLLVTALFIAQLAVLALSASDRLRIVSGVQANQTFNVTRTIVRLLDQSSPTDWPMIVDAFDDRNLDAEITAEASITPNGDDHHDRFTKWIERRLPEGFGPIMLRHDDTGFFDRDHWRRQEDGNDEGRRDRSRHGERVKLTIAMGLPDGRWLNLQQRLRPPPIWAGITWGYFALAAILISLVAILVVRRLTRPLRELAQAAETFGTGGNVPTLNVRGPIELRKAATAFNEMAARIGRFVRDRTAMIAAISHDLRTPITSLRLRAEFVEDEENRDKMLATIDEMAEMTQATLDFAKQDAQSEASQPLDLAALLESLAEDLSEQGLTVTADGLPRTVVSARATALKRGLRNLIENAVRYGECARVSIFIQADRAIVHIDDNGPGIPETELSRVFEPFTRLETSRNRETGGTGLGLAIARTIVHAHGGEVWLENRKPGLRAVVSLPVSRDGREVESHST